MEQWIFVKMVHSLPGFEFPSVLPMPEDKHNVVKVKIEGNTGCCLLSMFCIDSWVLEFGLV